MKIGNPPCAQFEILVDGKPRSYRDIKAVAIASAEFIKSRNPHSKVAVKEPADWRGDRRSQGVGRLMALTMRPTGLGSGAYQDNIDYNIFSGEWLIGRIYERNGFPDEVRFFWSLHGVVLTRPPSTNTDGAAATLEEAKAQFQKSWDAWMTWAGLKEVP